MGAPGVKVNLTRSFVQVTRQTALCKELLTMGEHTFFKLVFPFPSDKYSRMELVDQIFLIQL